MKSVGQIGYEAYAKFTNGKTFDGRSMPTWADLTERIQQAWQAATAAVVKARCLDVADYRWPSHQVVELVSEDGTAPQRIMKTAIVFAIADEWREGEDRVDCYSRLHQSAVQAIKHMNKIGDDQ